MEEKLRRGDRVRVVNPVTGEPYKIGDEGVVTNEGGGPGGVVKFDNGGSWYVYRKEVEVLEHAVPEVFDSLEVGEWVEVLETHPRAAPLNKGDRVKVMQAPCTREGCEGADCVRVSDTDGNPAGPGDNGWHVHRYQIKKVPTTEEEPAVADEKKDALPKEGDLIRIIKEVKKKGDEVPKTLEEGQYMVVKFSNSTGMHCRRVEDMDDEGQALQFTLLHGNKQYEVRQRA